ncbi:MAG: sulfotransferase [Glaciecola sp.]
MDNKLDDIRLLQTSLQQGKFNKVEIDAIALLDKTPSTEQERKVEILYVLAVCLRLQKKHTAAIEYLNKLLAIQHQHGRAHQELAYNYQANNNEKQASIHFYQATQINPALLTAWQALLPIYEKQQQTEAAAICKQHITRLLSLPKPVLGATDLLNEGKVAAADQLCRNYLQQNKHCMHGLLLLAEIALALKAFSEAEFILETCIELDPAHLEAKYQLFTVYNKLGKFAQALELTEYLLSTNPKNSRYLAAKATSLVGIGDVDQGIEIYEALNKQSQQNSQLSTKADANIYLLLGHAYKTAGNIHASIQAYQDAYGIAPSFGDAFWSLANTKTYLFSDKEIELMLEGVQSNNVSTVDKVHLHFALGKAFEDTKSFADSFEHYKKGNALQRTQTSYSSDKHTAFTNNQIAAFTPELKAQLQDLGHKDTAPIFIVGLPRAGSTLLEQILASHSLVDGTMELHEIMGLASKLSKGNAEQAVYPHHLTQLPKEYFKAFGEKFINDTHVYRQGGAYFIDKMPNNYMHIGLIKLILPNAKIIDARRDPMACCFSGFKQLFGEGQEFTYSLNDIAIYYKNYLRLMDHWQQLFKGEILLVEHENMVNNTEAEIRRMLDYCDLPFEQACLDFHKTKRAVKTPSAEQVRQPIYKSGLAQWENFAPYLGELKQHF